MAGHSKFKNIMHRKGRQDAVRAKAFNKLGREITVATKIGGGPDPDMNPRLRLAISKAKSGNMPNDRIKKAIEAGSGLGEGSDYEELRYEGYAVGGVAVVVEVLTDNRNRSASEVRSTFTKYGGAMGETGSVGFMFNHVGQIVFDAMVADEDTVFEAAVEAGADNVESDAAAHDVTTSIESFAGALDALTEKFGQPAQSGLIWKATTLSQPSEEQVVTLLKFINTLDDLDDVQNVYTNMDVDEAVLERAAS